MNIGTKIGARIAHFAEAEPIKKSTNIDNKMNPMIKAIPLALSSKVAPEIAMTVPMLDHEKYAII